MKALVAKGLLKIHNFKNAKNKWVYAYLLTPQGIAEKTALTSTFLMKKMWEYKQLKEEIEALSGGVVLLTKEIIGDWELLHEVK